MVGLNAQSLKSIFEKASKKGVKIRIAAPITKQTSKVVKELQGVAEVRHSEERSRFCVVDGKEIAFMLLDDEKVHPSYDVGVWVSTAFFAQSLQKFFDVRWQKMKPAMQVVKTL